jgi:dihydrofolate reductase
MTITLIAAASENNVIGRDGDLPWHLPADLAFFKDQTLGHTVIMGRKTWDSFKGSLIGRDVIIITRNQSLTVEEARIASSLTEALEIAGDQDEVFIAGGGEIYRLAMDIADGITLTRVHAEVEGDATFPLIDEQQWERVSAEHRAADDLNNIDCTFEQWQRR